MVFCTGSVGCGCVELGRELCALWKLLFDSNDQDQDVRPDPDRKLSANLYDIYHCCVYSEKLLMMDRGTVRNM